MSDDHYEKLFNMGISDMKNNLKMLELRLEKITDQKNRFVEVINSFKKICDEEEEEEEKKEQEYDNNNNNNSNNNGNN
jgi:hypothetical protein